MISTILNMSDDSNKGDLAIIESTIWLVKKNVSFTDAFNTTFMLEKGIRELYSYDEDFDKMEGIKRLTPE